MRKGVIKFDLEGDLYERRTHLLANSKLRKYSQEILKKFPFAKNYTILREFQTPDSIIHSLVERIDDIKITEKANSLKILKTDTTEQNTIK